MDEVIDKNACTGCSVCATACPKKAISMISDTLGFLYPVIDAELCVDCGICRNKCPANGFKAKNSISETLALINNDEQIRLKSSSGGVFWLLAKCIIHENGVVFGVRMDEFHRAVFDKAESVDELEPFMGSKYVQAYIGDVYDACREYLNLGRKVLFCGTPCQIAGLNSFLQQPYENLFCVDFVCHGVPSPALWKKYLAFREKQSTSPIVKTAFRHKKFGWKQFSLQLTFANCNEYCIPLHKDMYLQLFLKNNALRESCYNCFAKGKLRYSDITIADFWGIQKILPAFDDNKGTSLVCVNSVKGVYLMNQIKPESSVAEVELDKALLFNPAMLQSCKLTEKRACFEKDFENLTFTELFRKYGRDSFIEGFINFGKRCVKKVLCIIGLYKG